MLTKRWTFTPLVAFVLFALWTGCAKQGGGKVLAFKFKPGETTKYRTTMDMKSTIMGQAIAMKMVLEQSNIVKEVLPTGSARVEQRFDKATMTSDSPMGGMLAMAAKQIEGKSFQIVTSPSGKVESVSGFSDLGGASQSGMDLEQMASNFYSPLPEKAVQPGETWNLDKTIPLTSGGATLSNHIITRYTFLGYEQKGTANCAKIKTTGTFEITGSAGPQGSMSGKGTVDGLSYFDPEAGRMVEVTATSNTTMTVSPPKGVQMTMMMGQEIRMEIIP